MQQNIKLKTCPHIVEYLMMKTGDENFSEERDRNLILTYTFGIYNKCSMAILEVEGSPIRGLCIVSDYCSGFKILEPRNNIVWILTKNDIMQKLRYDSKIGIEIQTILIANAPK